MSQRARLSLRQIPGGTFHIDDQRRGLSNRPLPSFQLRIRFDIVAAADELNGILRDAVVATNEPFSVFPRSYWESFADRIAWHDQPPRYPEPEPWAYRGRHPFRFGEVWASVWDAPAPDVVYPVRRMRARRVLAVFLTQSPEEVPEPLVGLRYSLLTGRRLTCERDLNDAENHFERWWLEEVER